MTLKNGASRTNVHVEKVCNSSGFCLRGVCGVRYMIKHMRVTEGDEYHPRETVAFAVLME